MKRSRYSHLFRSQLKKIKGKELRNILKKKDEILNSIDLNHYKNLKHNLKKCQEPLVITSFNTSGMTEK